MRPWVFLLLVVLLVATCTARPGDPTLYPPKPGEPTVSVFLIDNGYHTDIALPGEVLLRGSGPTAQAARRLAPRNWVLAGWGDARFYVETGMSRERALDGLRALFRPGNPSVVRLTGVAQRPDLLYGDAAVELKMSRASFVLLVARIDRSLAEGPKLANAPRRPDRLFFRSVETFSILHLCNHWTAEVLNAGGVGVTPVLATFTPGLRFDLWLRRELADIDLDTARSGS
jgi:hypothetical protein